MEYKQIKAIEYANKKKWLNVRPGLTDGSGIYILTRRDEEGFRYAYVGQAKHILTRLAQHLEGHQQWIDLSIKKHGLYDVDNPYGWTVNSTILCTLGDLNEMEKRFIKKYADMGYQLRNKTSGSQGQGKSGISDNKPAKGYYDGKRQGYKDAQKFVKNLFDKYLDVSIRGKETVNAIKALEKFKAFLAPEDDNKE